MEAYNSADYQQFIDLFNLTISPNVTMIGTGGTGSDLFGECMLDIEYMGINNLPLFDIYDSAIFDMLGWTNLLNNHS